MAQERIAVIGAGPAGLSAAITAAVRQKDVWLFGNRSTNERLQKAAEIRNYPGFPSIDGVSLQSRFCQHLASLGTAVRQERVSGVYPYGGGFRLQTSDEEYTVDAVILAGGVSAERQLPGEKELLGHGVSYCATCDAFFVRGKTAAVIGRSEFSADEALFLAEQAASVLYFPMQPHTLPIHERIDIIPEQPLAVSDGETGRGVQTDHAFYRADMIFILHETVKPELLVPAIRTDGAHVAVDAQMQTNIPGCFACGDITGTPYQLPRAVGQGNIAALSAVRYLAQQKRARAHGDNRQP